MIVICSLTVPFSVRRSVCVAVAIAVSLIVRLSVRCWLGESAATAVSVIDRSNDNGIGGLR